MTWIALFVVALCCLALMRERGPSLLGSPLVEVGERAEPIEEDARRIRRLAPRVWHHLESEQDPQR